MASQFTAPSWVHNPPTGAKSDRLFTRMHYNHVGYGVVRDAQGAYAQVTDADDDLVRTSTAFYMGGRTYPISDSEAEALTAAGFSEYVTARPILGGTYSRRYRATY